MPMSNIINSSVVVTDDQERDIVCLAVAKQSDVHSEASAAGKALVARWDTKQGVDS